MLHCKFSGDYNSERIFKIGRYLTKLCVEHLGFTFFWPTLYVTFAMVLIVTSVFVTDLSCCDVTFRQF